MQSRYARIILGQHMPKHIGPCARHHTRWHVANIKQTRSASVTYLDPRVLARHRRLDKRRVPHDEKGAAAHEPEDQRKRIREPQQDQAWVSTAHVPITSSAVYRLFCVTTWLPTCIGSGAGLDAPRTESVNRSKPADQHADGDNQQRIGQAA